MLGDLKSHRLIIAKGLLFLLLGMLATGLLIFQAWDWRLILLHAIGVWAFCRFYYFAFYVIEKYVDSQYRFAGLTSFFGYLMGRDRSPDDTTAE